MVCQALGDQWWLISQSNESSPQWVYNLERETRKQIVTTVNVIAGCSGRRDEKSSSGEMWRRNESLQRYISLFFLIKLTAARRVGHLAHPTYLFSCSPFKFGGCVQLNVILTWFQCIDPIDSANTYWALTMSQEDINVNIWLPVSSPAMHGTFLKNVYLLHGGKHGNIWKVLSTERFTLPKPTFQWAGCS